MQDGQVGNLDEIYFLDMMCNRCSLDDLIPRHDTGC